jgi:hypothetical protein
MNEPFSLGTAYMNSKQQILLSFRMDWSGNLRWYLPKDKQEFYIIDGNIKMKTLELSGSKANITISKDDSSPEIEFTYDDFVALKQLISNNN